MVMTKLKNTNDTDYLLCDLRKVIAAGLRAEGPNDGRTYRVKVVYTKQDRGCSGYAYIGSGTIGMRIPRPHDRARRDWPTAVLRGAAVDGVVLQSIVRDFARVLVHEIGHTMGLEHDEMAKCREMEVAWVEGIQIRTQAPKVKAAPDREQKAIAAVERINECIDAEVKRHRRNVKALRTRLQKAKRSAGYYERKAAMAVEGTK
jgi:hypothetical protein